MSSSGESEVLSEYKHIWPFNLLDVFGYLGQGYLALIFGYLAYSEINGAAAVTYARTKFPLLENEWAAVPLGLLLSYILGHIISDLAYRGIELTIVHRVLGVPTAHSLGFIRAGRFRSILIRAAVHLFGIPEYTKRFPEPWRRDFNTKFKRMTGSDFDPFSGLRICFQVVQARSPAARERTSTFLNLYTFSRNASFTLGAAALVAASVSALRNYYLIGILALGSLFLMGRYLKFLRFYADEIILSFFAVSLEFSDKVHRLRDSEAQAQAAE